MREHFFGKYPELLEMVAQHDRRRHLAPEPRRPRSAEDLCGLCSRASTQGPAHRDPRQDREGLRHGQGRRGPESRRTSRRSSTTTRCATSATASAFRSPTTSSQDVPFYKPADDSAGDALPARASRGARRLPAARRAQRARAARGARARRLRQFAARQPTATRDLARRWRSCAS